MTLKFRSAYHQFLFLLLIALTENNAVHACRPIRGVEKQGLVSGGIGFGLPV